MVTCTFRGSPSGCPTPSRGCGQPSPVPSRTPEGTRLAHTIRAQTRAVHGALEALTPQERTALLPLLDRPGQLLYA